MRQIVISSRPELRAPGGVSGMRCAAGFPRLRSLIALLTVLGAGIVGLAPRTALAQNCQQRYGEAFQLIDVQVLSGRTPATIKQTVDNLFGPRQQVCGEAGYKFFLSSLGTQAAAGFRKKGAEQEARLVATREIFNRLPLKVRFATGADPASGIVQLRSDLTVLSKEVGVTPAIQGVLDALAALTPPTALVRNMPKDDDAIPVVVPKVPLPAWAIISLYEIRDHANRKENGEIINKTNLILDWVARINAGARPEDLKVAPATGTAPATAPATTPAPGTPSKPVAPPARPANP